jgi:hypothetical protein
MTCLASGNVEHCEKVGFFHNHKCQQVELFCLRNCLRSRIFPASRYIVNLITTDCVPISNLIKFVRLQHLFYLCPTFFELKVIINACFYDS